jgi:hypothetical protein
VYWYDYGARMYDPSLGRFMTVDPLAEIFDDQSPYLYAYNNPLRYTDCMGMGPIDEIKDRWNQWRRKRKAKKSGYNTNVRKTKTKKYKPSKAGKRRKWKSEPFQGGPILSLYSGEPASEHVPSPNITPIIPTIENDLDLDIDISRYIVPSKQVDPVDLIVNQLGGDNNNQINLNGSQGDPWQVNNSFFVINQFWINRLSRLGQALAQNPNRAVQVIVTTGWSAGVQLMLINGPNPNVNIQAGSSNALLQLRENSIIQILLRNGVNPNQIIPSPGGGFNVGRSAVINIF